jgi:hypothetical protein
MTQEKEPESKMASSPFCDFLSLGAGVTPAEGSVKPTAGFTLNRVISPSHFLLPLSPMVILQRAHFELFVLQRVDSFDRRLRARHRGEIW